MKRQWLTLKLLVDKKLVALVSTMFFVFSVALSTALSTVVMAQEQVIETVKTEPTVTNIPQKIDIDQPSPQVGKHVGGNMDAMSMILSLFMVLALIGLTAFILKRIQPGRFEQKDLKIVTRLALGAKESLVVVQVGDKQQLLGVTSGQITLLDTLEQPIKATNSPLNKVDGLAKSLVSFLQKPAPKSVQQTSTQEQANSNNKIKNGASSLSQFKNQQL